MAFDTYNGIHFDNNDELADIIRKEVATEYQQEILKKYVELCDYAKDKATNIEKEVKRRIDGYYGSFS